MRRSFHRFLMFVSAFALCMSAPLAGAQAPPDTPSPDASPAGEAELGADELKAAGDSAMLDLRYDDALAFYQKSYALEPNPALLYNQGRAYQARGSFPEARIMLRRFRVEAPPELRARVPRLDELIGEVEQKVTTLTVEVNVPGATIRIRNQPFGESPMAAMVVNSGAASITATKSGYRVASTTETLVGGGAQTVKLVLVPLKTTGLLRVRAVAGARVFVDGKAIGSVPADVELKPGKHKVVVLHEDYEDAHTTVVMAAGATRLHKVELVEIPALYERWWFWSGVGALSATAAIVIAAAVLEGPVDEGNIAPGSVSAPLMTVLSF